MTLGTDRGNQREKTDGATSAPVMVLAGAANARRLDLHHLDLQGGGS